MAPTRSGHRRVGIPRVDQVEAKSFEVLGISGGQLTPALANDCRDQSVHAADGPTSHRVQSGPVLPALEMP